MTAKVEPQPYFQFKFVNDLGGYHRVVRNNMGKEHIGIIHREYDNHSPWTYSPNSGQVNLNYDELIEIAGYIKDLGGE